MVQSRLTRRLKATGLHQFEDYLDLVESKAGSEEQAHMISALTTNVSHFFREDHHFSILREMVTKIQDDPSRQRRLRIWSAGCSTGQEAYSVAMTLLDVLADASDWDIRILATDIDRRVLGVAKRGVYRESELTSIDPKLRKLGFRQTGDGFEICDDVRKLIAFRTLNLIADWPMSGPFDVIFCRNVLIYFSEDTQRTLWPRFRGLLRVGGTLFLGHSERIPDPAQDGFRVTGITTYCGIPQDGQEPGHGA